MKPIDTNTHADAIEELDTAHADASKELRILEDQETDHV